MAPTKTLAKIANRMAKRAGPAGGAVLDWSRVEAPRDVLAALPVEDIWGISKRWGARLRRIGIADALALAEAHPPLLRHQFGVVMERIAHELNGISCLPLETVSPPRRQILVSRSFGEKLSHRDDLRAAVAAFATRAGEKLRAARLLAPAIGVYLHTSPFATAGPRHAESRLQPLDPPTDDSGTLVRAAVESLDRMYRAGHAYQKAGVLLPDLASARHAQDTLFRDDAAMERSAHLMAAIDRINHEQGRGTLRYATQLLGQRWQMRQGRLSTATTTRWRTLPTVAARMP